MVFTIKVLTLNCWGVFTPLCCQFRNERMDAIGKELTKGEFDIVLLQEIWTQADYEKLCNKILPSLPYTHYWHSGMFGTGCCIFSKHPILDTFLHRFGVNGYAHRPQHGDWFGGKGVGLAQVELAGGVRANVYCTHTHAQYNEESDEYEAHRVAQGYEMGQFIKLTSGDSDVVIVGGDFNFQPRDLGFKLIKHNANLKDGWIDQLSDPEDRGEFDGGTNCRSDNPLTETHWSKMYPRGIRIDYLLYTNNAGYDITCEKCYLTMQKVPNESYHYSDHEGVAAIFKIKKNLTAMVPERNRQELEKNFTAAIPVLETGMQKVKARQAWYAVMGVLCIVFLVFLADVTLPWGLGFLLAVLRWVLSCASAYAVWYILVLSQRELNGLLSARKDINNLLKSGSSM